jgi:hypothetical protein
MPPVCTIAIAQVWQLWAQSSSASIAAASSGVASPRPMSNIALVSVIGIRSSSRCSMPPAALDAFEEWPLWPGQPWAANRE